MKGTMKATQLWEKLKFTFALSYTNTLWIHRRPSLHCVILCFGFIGVFPQRGLEGFLADFHEQQKSHSKGRWGRQWEERRKGLQPTHQSSNRSSAKACCCCCDLQEPQLWLHPQYLCVCLCFLHVNPSAHVCLCFIRPWKERERHRSPQAHKLCRIISPSSSTPPIR